MNVGCWDANVLHIYYLLTYTSTNYIYTNLVAICFNPWIDGTTLSQISATTKNIKSR